MMVEEIQREMERLADPERAATHQRFFKTGKGEYGEGDIFRGIRVPEIRKLAKRYKDIPLKDAERLIHSPFHEDRELALVILVCRFAKGDESLRREIYSLYLTNTKYINNWDLVDISAEHIIGAFLIDRDKEPLMRLADSDILWERRIAVIATFHFIKKGRFDETLMIAARLLNDPEDLIHKAVGWMLREIGKRDMPAEETFLKQHYRRMPRTMLRYAIERFPEAMRLAYLKGRVF
jgi:3-methyladenine DNA glycosylase AlkD